MVSSLYLVSAYFTRSIHHSTFHTSYPRLFKLRDLSILGSLPIRIVGVPERLGYVFDGHRDGSSDKALVFANLVPIPKRGVSVGSSI